MAALLPNEPLKERARAILRNYVKEELEVLAPSSRMKWPTVSSRRKGGKREVSSEVIDTILVKIQELARG